MPIPEESFVRRLEKESEMDFDDDYYEDKDTILIIDDSEKNRSLLTGVLSDKYNVIEADEGEDGLHILKKNIFRRLVLLYVVQYVTDVRD